MMKMIEPTRMAQTSVVQEAVSKINALRKLTRESGCISKNTQSMILRALRPEEMIAVAEVLAQQSEVDRG
jgi:phage protein D